MVAASPPSSLLLYKKCLGGSPAKSLAAPIKPVVIVKKNPTRAQSKIESPKLINSNTPKIIEPVLSSIAPATPKKISPTQAFLNKSSLIESSIVTTVNPILESGTKLNSSLVAKSFVRNFILDRTQDVQAIIIQNAWRLSQKKKHFYCFLHLRIKYNRRLEKLIFLGWISQRRWHGSDVHKMRDVYYRLQTHVKDTPFVFRKREWSPFPYFYVTGQVFIAKDYTANDLYAFIYLLNSISMTRAFKLWRLTAHNRKVHRHSLDFIRFPMKKQKAFGPAITCFSMWKHYVQLHKLNKSIPPSTNSPFLTLNLSRDNVKWKIVESTLNKYRLSIGRAIDHSKRRIKSKTVLALFNRSIERMTEMQVIQQADAFRLKNLQNLAHRAWLKYMEIQQRLKQVQRDYIKAWYELTYERARIKTMISFYKKRDVRFFCQKILNKWIAIARVGKMKNRGVQLKMQQNTSLVLTFLLPLMGRQEQYLQVAVFRGWIRFMRSRKRWKRFSSFSDFADHDREIKYGFLIEMKRQSATRLTGRVFGSGNSIIPRRLGYSMEQTLAEQRNARDFADPSIPTKYEIFRRPSFSYMTLVRCLLMAMHKRKSMDIGPPPPRPPLPVVEMMSDEDVKKAINQNIRISRDNINRFFTRGTAILKAIETHEKAKEMESFGFSTSASPNFELVPRGEITEEHIVVTREQVESVDALVRHMEMFPPRLVSTFKEERDAAFQAFDKHMRDPAEMNQHHLGNSIIDAFQMLHDGILSTSKNISSQANRNPRISAFAKKTKTSTIMSILSREKNTGELPADFVTSKASQVLSTMRTADKVEDSLTKTLMAMTHIVTNVSGFFEVKTIEKGVDPMLRRAALKTAHKLEKALSSAAVSSELVPIVCRVYHAVRMTKLSQYTEAVPFADDVEPNDDLILDTRFKLWSAIKKMYPGLEIPSTGMGVLKNNSSVNFKSVNTTNIALDRIEELTSKEAYVACFLLPCIFPCDYVPLFIADECRAER